MVDRDVVLAKLDTIDRCLGRIADVRGPRREELRDVDVEDIVHLNLQRAAQAAIDLAHHVVASEGWPLPGSLAAAFSTLEAEGVLESALAERLRKMAGFRNVAVHAYDSLNPAIVESIVTKHLGDLRDLGRTVRERYREVLAPDVP